MSRAAHLFELVAESRHAQGCPHTSKTQPPWHESPNSSAPTPTPQPLSLISRHRISGTADRCHPATPAPHSKVVHSRPSATEQHDLEG